jgi:hypothetical protein
LTGERDGSGLLAALDWLWPYPELLAPRAGMP